MKNRIFNGLIILFLLLNINTTTSYAQTTIDNRIPVDVLDGCNYSIYCITEPGHYYLRENIEVNYIYNYAILIESDNVTLDLNGYTIVSVSQFPFNGIRVFGSFNNIVIKNGTIRGFSTAGIRASLADRSSFFNLKLHDNGDDGLNVGDNCLVYNCVATNNESYGIQVNKASIIRDCTSSYNGGGIDSGNGATIYNCTSSHNASNGIVGDDGSHIEGCTSYENGSTGIVLRFSGICLRNTVYQNGVLGIYALGHYLIKENISNNNGVCINDNTCGYDISGSNFSFGAGIFVSGEAVIENNECVGNYFGISTFNNRTTINDNKVQKNKHAGIITKDSRNLIIRNKTEGNGFEQSPSVDDTNTYPLGNIVFIPGYFETCSVGPIIDVSNSGDITTLNGADHPFANFIY